MNDEARLAWLWPVVIDGTILVALLTVLAANRAARKTGYPWALAGLFSAASVAFNIAHAPDRPVAQLVFVMAPVTLVLTTHLLIQQVGWRNRRSGLDRLAAPAEAAEPDADLRSGSADMSATISDPVRVTPGVRLNGGRPDPDPELGMTGPALDRTGPDLQSGAATSGPRLDLQAQARQIYEQYRAAGWRVSGATLARQFGTSERHGRRLLAEFRAGEGSAGPHDAGVAKHKQAGPMRT